MERRIMEADVETLRKVVQDLYSWAKQIPNYSNLNTDYSRGYSVGVEQSHNVVLYLLDEDLGNQPAIQG